MIRYRPAPDVRQLAQRIVEALELGHVSFDQVHFLRSFGSRASRISARIHGLPRVFQEALGITPQYVIEVVGEEYDKLSADAKEMVLIHELLHIPRAFGGGLLPHCGNITRSKVDYLHRRLKAS